MNIYSSILVLFTISTLLTYYYYHKAKEVKKVNPLTIFFKISTILIIVSDLFSAGVLIGKYIPLPNNIIFLSVIPFFMIIDAYTSYLIFSRMPMLDLNPVYNFFNWRYGLKKATIFIVPFGIFISIIYIYIMLSLGFTYIQIFTAFILMYGFVYSNNFVKYRLKRSKVFEENLSLMKRGDVLNG